MSFGFRISSFLRHSSLGFRHSMCCYLPGIAAVLLLACSSVARAQDLVIVSGNEGKGRIEHSGRVVEYRGEGLRLRTRGGRIISFPAKQVLQVRTKLTAVHRSAEVAAVEGRVAESLQLYQQALSGSVEKRPWVRRRILASIVRAQSALGRQEEAGKLFLSLLRDDPATPHLAAIPLAWTSADQVASATAGRWLANARSSTEMLLAASHLLHSEQHVAALSGLGKLRTAPDATIALLAEAQLWRLRILTVKKEELPRWRKTIHRLPGPLQSGPYHVLGLALARDGQHQQAALALLRVPLLDRTRRNLAAESLLAAGKSLAELGRKDQAARLWAELNADFSGTLAAAEAKLRLNELKEAP